MSLKQTAIKFWQFGQLPDVDGFLADHRAMAAAQVPLGVVAGVVVGGLFAGMSFTDMLTCGLVAAGGVALFCAVAAKCLFGGLWTPARSGPSTTPFSPPLRSSCDRPS